MLTPPERAAKLFTEAKVLGLDGPTEGMVQSAINDAVSDVLANYGEEGAHARYYSDLDMDDQLDWGDPDYQVTE